MSVSQQSLDKIALSREEYDLIVSRLGRELNELPPGLLFSEKVK